MPKESRERSLSLERSSLSPFPCRSSSRQSLPKNSLENYKNVKPWEDARCPVCMEHPHNAVLLICSSHDKGCRPFMCDTSYRHSNCFDQFRKSFQNTPVGLQSPEDMSSLTLPLLLSTASVGAISNSEIDASADGSIPVLAAPTENSEKSKLLCPLCRGQIIDLAVVESARRYMNARPRSCASETCDFTGTYSELRKHARLVHPFVRPTEADPERQRSWRRLERQRDLGDLLSTLQSSIGEERTEESSLTLDEGGWLTVFFLVRFIRPGSSSSSRSRSTRARAQVAIRRSPRRLWGETYDEVEHGGPRDDNHDDDDDDDDDGSGGSSDIERYAHRRYVRRRLDQNQNQNQNQ